MQAVRVAVVSLPLLLQDAQGAVPAPVGVAGLSASPSATHALSLITPGLDDRLRAVLVERHLAVTERPDDLFPRPIHEPTVVLGGYLERLECGPGGCRAEVVWELYDVRPRMVVRSITAIGTGTGDTVIAAAQRAVAASLGKGLDNAEFMAGIPTTSILPPAWTAPLVIPACPVVSVALPNQVDLVLDAVVIIRTRDGTGSGVLISPEGHVATVAHVVDREPLVEVELHNGLVLYAPVLRVDQAFDVAILDLPGTGYACSRLADVEPQIGQETFVVGAPLGDAFGWSISRGVVSSVRVLDDRAVLQTDASINPGNSGGPLFDATGVVDALASFKLSQPGVEGLAFGVPAAVWAERLNVRSAPAGEPPPVGEARYAWTHVRVDAGGR